MQDREHRDLLQSSSLFVFVCVWPRPGSPSHPVVSDNEYGGRSLQTSSQMSDGDRENATSINLDKETQLSAAGETDNDDPFINKKISIQSNLLKAS